MRRPAILLAFVTAVTMVGCTSTGSETVGSSSAGSKSAESASPSTPELPPADLSITSVSADKTPVLEINRVQGLTWREKDGSFSQRQSWFEIPGADPLNQMIAGDLSAIRTEWQKADHGPIPAAGGAHSAAGQSQAASALAPVAGPGKVQLGSTTTLVTVSPKVLGVRLSSFSHTKANTALDFRSLYYDTTGKKVVEGTGLFSSPETQTKFTEAVRKALVDGSIVDAPTAAKLTPAQVLRSVVFRTDGTAVAELSQGVLPGLGSVAVPVKAEDVAEWLSPFGKQVQEAAKTPGTYPAGLTLPAESKALDKGYGTTTSEAVRVNCAVEKCVALTYDDGPVPWTNQLLDTLKQKNVKATFFTVGSMAKAHPGILQREQAEGHEIGNHSMTHTAMTKQDDATLDFELNGNSERIKAATGKMPTLMRPPYGATNDRVNKKIGDHKMEVVIWDVDTADWSTKNADATVAAVDSQVQPGSIVLMHDLQQSTVDAAPRVIDVLAAKGYKFVTVSELMAGTNPQVGVDYYFRPGSMPSEDRTKG